MRARDVKAGIILAACAVICAGGAAMMPGGTARAMSSGGGCGALHGAPRKSWPMTGVLSLRGGTDGMAGVPGSTARDVAKATALLEKARAGFAAAGVQPPEKLAQIDELNRLLNEDGQAIAHGDQLALERLKRSVGVWDQKMGAEKVSVVDSDEDRDDWEAEVDKLKEEGDEIEKEIRTGVKRGSEFNHWNEIPALRKAELEISSDSHHPLWKAVRDANVDRLQYLLKSRSEWDINHAFPSLWNSSLLHVAAEGEDVDVLTLLVTSGAAMEQRNTYCQAPLHLASYWGNRNMIRRLVDMGADVEVRSSDASTPLHIAAFYGQNDTAKELVVLGASLTSVYGCVCARACVRARVRLCSSMPYGDE
jgi:hypothetical protein